MRRIIAIVFIAVIVFAGTCSAHDSPKVVVEKYLKAVRSNNYDEAYFYISKTDTTIINWLELIRYVRKIAPPKLTRVIDLAHNATRQEIVSTSLGGNTAKVKIRSVVPDMEETLRVTQDTEIIKSLLAGGGLPKKERLGECILIVENDVWKISNVSGVSSGQVAEIATCFAELILGKEEAKRINKKISEYAKKLEEGV